MLIDFKALAQSPLQGVVLCCTSIPPERRNKLAEIARQMGACHNYDLTGDVTHLLVGSIDSQKYKYVAKQRPDVKVVLPEWIDAVRESWMQGGGTDVAALEAEYRAPALFGLRICVTGFEDLTERQRLQQCVNENGAEYHGDLTKQVTHLIVASPTGKKYTYARQWAVNTVAVEWLLDSIERGMVLEESFYDPLMDPADRGRNSWNREALAHASRSKKRPLGDGGGLGRRDAGSRRKLRRTASAKLESQSYALWEGIAGASATTVMPEGQLRDTTQEFSLRNGQSPNNASTRTKKVPIRTSSPELLHSDGATGNPVPKRHGIFQGRLVFVTNFDDRKNSLVSGHLSANGAEVILSTEELEGFTGDDLQRGYLILPHNKPFGDAQIPKAAEPMQIVTEWWVESCLARKMLLGPSEGLFLQPFPHARVSAGFEGVTICSTSFTDLDLLHVTRAVNLMGATYDEWFKESHHILISNTPRPSAEKVSFAQENGIPIVRKEWLLDSIAKGVKQPFDDYALFPLSRNPIERGDSAVISEQTRDDSLLSNENHR
ncbi:BRCT domain-containing protein [Lineolata rhizophorae]|uniref:BRCT domain-containing protein n=1 Tax=Lineolata rhizophorae TaxID=578093 RepID=A0A6A6NPC6_9PEZI|nr:BRCT domain-containing protein [Lineolata rhizophorae]